MRSVTDRRRPGKTLVVALAAAALALLSHAAAADDTASVSRLRALAAEHPDDPDLQWALARAESATDPAAGADRVEAYVARWPDRRDDAWLELGKLRAAAGQDERALAAFDRAAAQAPDSGVVQLHRGLALRRLGRLDEANQALARAAELEPALRQESLLLRGADELAAGRRDAGVALLDAAISVDPSSEGARRARILLPRDRTATPSRIGLFAQSGVEYDSNVTLDNKLHLQTATHDPDDVAGIWSAGGTFRVLGNERASFTLGYRYDGSAYTELTDYNVQGHLGVASVAWRALDRVTLRLDGTFSHLRLGDARYAESRALRPAVFFALGEQAGVSSVYGQWERVSYFDEPTLSSLDQDGRWLALGVEHTLPLPGLPGALATFGGRFANLDTGASRDLLGFESAYDQNVWTGSVALSVPLFWRTTLGVAGSLSLERYDNPNVVDFLTGDNGFLDPTPERRRDRVWQYGATLSRPLYRRIWVDLQWRATNRISNVPLYAYDRNVVALMFRFQTD